MAEQQHNGNTTGFHTRHAIQTVSSRTKHATVFMHDICFPYMYKAPQSLKLRTRPCSGEENTRRFLDRPFLKLVWGDLVCEFGIWEFLIVRISWVGVS